MIRIVFSLLVTSLLSLSGNRLGADDLVSTATTLVPQTLLRLVHAPEVQQEIGVDQSSREEFENFLREVDAQWWPSRNWDSAKQRGLVSQLEEQLKAFVIQKLGDKAWKRLREIEYQSQGVRIFARPEVTKMLGLEAKQTQINAIFQSTDKLAKSEPGQKPEESKVKAYQEAAAKEAKVVLEMLSTQQRQRLGTLLGKTLDTSKLERIFPLAPELISNEHTYGNGTIELSKLKGKVVLVHFYAFQCHNCIANFKHYKRWSQSLKERGVAVIGIQTPETNDERDPVKIAKAAKREGFEFPIIMDLENRNWNAWGNTMWPTVYVIDKQGYIRTWWEGELNWSGATGDKAIEEIVDRLLQEP